MCKCGDSNRSASSYLLHLQACPSEQPVGGRHLRLLSVASQGQVPVEDDPPHSLPVTMLVRGVGGEGRGHSDRGGFRYRVFQSGRMGEFIGGQ